MNFYVIGWCLGTSITSAIVLARVRKLQQVQGLLVQGLEKTTDCIKILSEEIYDLKNKEQDGTK